MEIIYPIDMIENMCKMLYISNLFQSICLQPLPIFISSFKFTIINNRYTMHLTLKITNFFLFVLPYLLIQIFLTQKFFCKSILFYIYSSCLKGKFLSSCLGRLWKRKFVVGIINLSWNLP